MDRKPVSNAALAALGAFQGTIERPSNFRRQALEHNLGRNVRVVKLLRYIDMMRRRGVTLAGPIECVAAIRQNFSSSQNMTLLGMPAGSHQAAHFLPGQLRIGGRNIWQFATSAATRGQIEFLFAEVEHLPVAFNQADTAAEAKGQSGGLCGALADACTTLLRGNPAPGAGNALQTGYEEWQRRALTALENAAGNKTAKPGIPALQGNPLDGYTPESIAARSRPSESQWNRDESLRILGYYLEDQEHRTWQWVMGSCQGALREVESNFFDFQQDQ